jgi:YD repeat-containing protein
LGYGAVKSSFDDRGRQIETAYLGTDGRPTRGDEGYSIARFVYDDRGHTERVVLLDENRQAIAGVNGFASWLLKRNAAGQRIEVAYYDEREALTLTRRPGSATRRWTFDSHGRVIERADYDTSGRPMVNAFGYSIMTFSYDEFGREVSRGLLDATRRPLTMRVAIDKVRKGSVAADVGLRPGDVILTYAGTAVDSSDQFTTKLELFKGDRGRDLTIARGDRVLTVTIPPGRLVGAELQEIAR